MGKLQRHDLSLFHSSVYVSSDSRHELHLLGWRLLKILYFDESCISDRGFGVESSCEISPLEF